MRRLAKSGRSGPFEWFVALRLLGKTQRSYVSLVSSVAMWGLAIGVASLVVVFSVTAGFEQVFRDKILGIYPHLVVIGMGGDLPEWQTIQKRIAAQDGVVTATPATYDEMMASHSGRRGSAIVKGLDTTSKPLLRDLAALVQRGELGELNIEPVVTEDAAGGLTISALPGGSRFVLIRPPDGATVFEPIFKEAGKQSVAGWRSYLPFPVELSMGSALFPQQLLLEPNDKFRFSEIAAEQTLDVSLNGLPHVVPFRTGLNLVIPVGEQRHLLDILSCHQKDTGTSREPASICAFNLSDTPLTVSIDGTTRTVAPGESQALIVDSTSIPKVILGEELAKKIEADIGDRIRLVSPLSTLSGFGSDRRPGRSIADEFEVVGTVRIGFYEYDSELALLDFSTARRFLHQGDVARWLEVRIEDLLESEKHRIRLLRSLSEFTVLNLVAYLPEAMRNFEFATVPLSKPTTELESLGNLVKLIRDTKYGNTQGQLSFGAQDSHRVITWQEMNKPLFSSMKRQRIVLSLFFLIIIIVAAFNVVTSQIMIVREKTGNIAIMKAMGATHRQIRRVFLIQGMSLGLLGLLIGLALGFAICGFLIYIGFPLDPKVYLVSELPVDINIRDVAISCIMSLASIYVAVSVAARKAADKQPVDGLRELE